MWRGVAIGAVILAAAAFLGWLGALVPRQPQVIIVKFEGPLVVRLEERGHP